MKKLLTVIIFLTFLPTLTFANYKYFRAVQSTAEMYRVECSTDQMKLVDDNTGGKSFYLNLKSNRNNFEMVMLVGFIAAGQAMKTGIEPSTVFVAVDIPLGEGFQLLATASREDILKLTSGEITTEQFVRLIQYI